MLYSHFCDRFNLEHFSCWLGKPELKILAISYWLLAFENHTSIPCSLLISVIKITRRK